MNQELQEKVKIIEQIITLIDVLKCSKKEDSQFMLGYETAQIQMKELLNIQLQIITPKEPEDPRMRILQQKIKDK